MLVSPDAPVRPTCWTARGLGVVETERTARFSVSPRPSAALAMSSGAALVQCTLPRGLLVYQTISNPLRAFRVCSNVAVRAYVSFSCCCILRQGMPSGIAYCTTSNHVKVVKFARFFNWSCRRATVAVLISRERATCLMAFLSCFST